MAHMRSGKLRLGVGIIILALCAAFLGIWMEARQQSSRPPSEMQNEGMAISTFSPAVWRQPAEKIFQRGVSETRSKSWSKLKTPSNLLRTRNSLNFSRPTESKSRGGRWRSTGISSAFSPRACVSGCDGIVGSRT